jgi:hypothetical protein
VRLLPLAILVATLGLSACVLDVGMSPSERLYPDAINTQPSDGDDQDTVAADASAPNQADGDDQDTVAADASAPNQADGDDQDTVAADASAPNQADGVITDTDTDTIGPGPSTPVPLRQGAWPATFTTTLQGDGWTLQPLGAQRGFTGTVSAPDGSLHLEALP